MSSPGLPVLLLAFASIGNSVAIIALAVRGTS